MSMRRFAMKASLNSLLEVCRRLCLCKQLKRGIDLLFGTVVGMIEWMVHRLLLSFVRRPASSRRARKMRERMDDSVVEQIVAISAVDNSSSAERSSACRSFAGS